MLMPYLALNPVKKLVDVVGRRALDGLLDLDAVCPEVLILHTASYLVHARSPLRAVMLGVLNPASHRQTHTGSQPAV